jgi:hypothetical protein
MRNANAAREQTGRATPRMQIESGGIDAQGN